MPALIKTAVALDWDVELLREPDLTWDGLLEPLLEVACVQCSDGLPVTEGVFLGLPSSLARPVTRRDEDKCTVCPVRLWDRSNPGCIVLIGFCQWIFVAPELPSGFAARRPGSGRARIHDAVP